MKFYSLIFIVYFLFMSLSAEKTSVRLFINSGYDTTLTFQDIKDYGLLHADKSVILFKVIDSIQTCSETAAERLHELASDTNIKVNDSIFTIIISKDKIKTLRISNPIKPIYGYSLNLLYSNQATQEYGISLMGKLWFFDNSLYKVGGSAGRLNDYMKDSMYNFYMGFGYRKQILFFCLDGLLNYMSSMDPKYRRKIKGSRSKGSFGLELLIQTVIANKLSVIIDTNYYFSDNLLVKRDSVLLSFGLGYFFDEE